MSRRKRALRKLGDQGEEIDGPEIIRSALAHALFDADPILYEGFAHTVYDGRAEPCDAPYMLANRIYEELAYARYEVVETRETPRAVMTAINGRIEFVELVELALKFGGKQRWAKLGHPNPAVAAETRKLATEKICEALSIGRCVLARRKE